MPYPFKQLPSLAVFIETALMHDCKRVVFPAKLFGPEGEVEPKCLKGPKGVTVVLPDIGPDECLTPRQLSWMCRQLGINEGLFGVGAIIN